MSNSKSSGGEGLRSAAIVGGVILLMVLVGWIWLANDKPQEPPANGVGAGGGTPPAVRKLTAEDCLRLTERKNRALGHLENSDPTQKIVELDQALELLGQLAKELPDEPAVYRNLAVAHVMSIAAGKDAAALPAVLDKLRQLEPKSSAAPFLTARALLARKELASAKGDFLSADALEAQAVVKLEEAAALDPSDPSLWGEIAQICKDSQDPELRKKRSAALRSAMALAPGNIALAARWMKEQVADQDAGLGETLKSLRVMLQPFAEGIRQRAHVNPLDLVDQAEQLLEQSDWARLLMVQKIENVMLREDWWKSDNRQLFERHVLEFVTHEFPSLNCAAEPSDLVDPPQVRLVRRAPGGALKDLGGGVRELQVHDVDLDGMFDVVALGPDRLAVFGRGDLTRPWGLVVDAPLTINGRGVLAADLDRESKEESSRSGTACHDADVDFIVFGEGGVQVFRNDVDAQTGQRVLYLVEQDDQFQALRGVLAGVLVDADADGDLDVVFSSSSGLSLWLNRGDMEFFEVSSRAALPPVELRATGLLAVDWDLDCDLDVLAAGPGDSPAGYLENLRHGSFRWRPLEGAGAELTGASALCLEDSLAPGAWGLIAAGESGIRRVPRSVQFPLDGGQPTPVFTVDHAATVAEVRPSRLQAWDFDNDSRMDLLAWGPDGLTILRGEADGAYADRTAICDTRPQAVAACATGDLDGDGDLDLVVADAQGVALFDNEGGNENHWLNVRLRGESDPKGGRSNQLGVGSTLELRAGTHYRAQVVSSQVTHFGLGRIEQADAVRVLWTHCVPQAILNPKADTSVCETQKTAISSCPFVYAWNGERFEFQTDLLWNAPLGLQFAEGVLTQPRAWEYLKLEGERVQPRDGRYVLQFTSELWEADYFDQIELIAVDHPADVEIYSNEKVGPAEIAAFGVHTVRHPRAPLAATNQRGEDVLETIARRDGNYLSSHTRNYRMGLTDEHYLELDLGDLRDARKVTLFLTGWIFPSDTSVRIGAAQNPRWPAARPPALLVPDAHGQWREALPFMGFPGGKPKTIAVDLSGVFLTDDYRVRIVTNWELYWDEAFFTVDEPPAPMKLTTLPVAAADLHARGFSAIRRTTDERPEFYVYDEVSSAPKWPPIYGLFTRFGDVTALLLRQDDMQAILAPGDEMTVSFAMPAEPPPPGWKRDFLLHNVGWDKDAVLGTVYGQTVEPLPFHGMSRYPYGPDQAFPDTPAHRQYLHDYQTRTQEPARFWRQAVEMPIDARTDAE